MCLSDPVPLTLRRFHLFLSILWNSRFYPQPFPLFSTLLEKINIGLSVTLCCGWGLDPKRTSTTTLWILSLCHTLSTLSFSFPSLSLHTFFVSFESLILKAPFLYKKIPPFFLFFH
ncbi:hypothetical protein RJT34_23451 [Clitoria ternatea]|uniref:Uncharacterized protein n=1 Tax=Clitoria ternatea TaxID=43366 RepID=A0AAN9IF00_CLITE